MNEEIQSASPHAFPQAQIDGVYRAIRERRDVRHFKPGPLEAGQLERFIAAAHNGPSVGLMQPWRFIRIASPALRAQIHQLVDDERKLTAEALGQRAEEFMRLKVEGILACAEVLVVGLIDRRERFVFGRRTMPEMDLASASCAIQNFWLAARAEGIGAGWVSLFDPQRLREVCGMPEGSQPIAVLCVGRVEEFYRAPMLELERWDQRMPVQQILYEDSWGAQQQIV
ncbi:5,6-dimethylbenzimidazole synthase [Pseudoduganella aquatica]|uniref:5,6-dimethylbenzimidazole synthase n=1 Tax=Pseudoduganella aquatica TaxID=2660641 RepID=UPI001E62521D|nr:5,6-dimethylbenzimidazole synthase [Pseudoduganella aquatica]